MRQTPGGPWTCESVRALPAPSSCRVQSLLRPGSRGARRVHRDAGRSLRSAVTGAAPPRRRRRTGSRPSPTRAPAGPSSPCTLSARRASCQRPGRACPPVSAPRMWHDATHATLSSSPACKERRRRRGGAPSVARMSSGTLGARHGAMRALPATVSRNSSSCATSVSRSTVSPSESACAARRLVEQVRHMIAGKCGRKFSCQPYIRPNRPLSCATCLRARRGPPANEPCLPRWCRERKRLRPPPRRSAVSVTATTLLPEFVTETQTRDRWYWTVDTVQP